MYIRTPTALALVSLAAALSGCQTTDGGSHAGPATNGIQTAALAVHSPEARGTTHMVPNSRDVYPATLLIGATCEGKYRTEMGSEGSMRFDDVSEDSRGHVTVRMTHQGTYGPPETVYYRDGRLVGDRIIFDEKREQRYPLNTLTLTVSADGSAVHGSYVNRPRGGVLYQPGTLRVTCQPPHPLLHTRGK